jgi:hypothetical protein
MRGLLPKVADGDGKLHDQPVDPLRAGLAYVDATLKKIDVSYEEWEILFRERLLLITAARGETLSPQAR